MNTASTARRLALILGSLTVISTLQPVFLPQMDIGQTGIVSPFNVALHLIGDALVPAVGVVVLARAGAGTRGRTGLLILAAHGILRLVTALAFLLSGIGWQLLVSLAGVSLVFPVATAVAALAGLRGAGPWLATDVSRHPARVTAVAGAAALVLSEWLPTVPGARLSVYPYWPFVEVVFTLAMLAGVAAILRAAEPRDAAAVAGVAAVHAGIWSTARVVQWLMPPADVMPAAPGVDTVASALAAVLLGAAAIWLLRDNAASRVAANPAEPARRKK